MTNRGEPAKGVEAGARPATAENTASALSDDSGSENLSGRAQRGVAYSAASRVLTQVMQFAVTVVLARLIAPAEYGLVAIVATFTGFATLFTDLGIGAALIHRRNLRQSDKDTAFWINALSGLVLTALFCALAVPIAAFYDRPRLVGLIVIASFNFSLSLSIVPSSLLQRALMFRQVAKVEVVAAIGNAVVTIALATAHVGAVSIVFGTLAQTVITTVLMTGVVRYRPRGFIDRSSAGALWGFGGHLFGFNVLNYWARNLDNLLIGRFSGPTQLAYYARAYNLMMLPVQQVTAVMGRVLFPALAAIQEDVARLRNAYLRALVVSTALTVPLSVGLAAASNAFVIVTYGERWQAAAPLLVLLAASGPAQVISGSTGALYQSLGRTNVQLRRGLFNTSVTVLAIVVGLHWGATGVAVALLAKFYLLVPNSAAGCWPVIGLQWREVLRRLWPLVVSAFAMATVMVVARIWMRGEAPIWVLLAQISVGVAVYIGVMSLLDRSTLIELASFFRRSRRGADVVDA